MNNRRCFRTAALLLVVVLSVSCVSLSKKYPEIRLFTLDPVRSSEAAPATVEQRTLLVRMFTASPACEDANFLLRKSGSRVEKDFHNRFVVSPAELVQDQTAAWLRSNGVFSNVTANPRDGQSDWTLAGHILRLEGDFSGDSPAAVMSVQYTFSPSTGKTGERFFKTYDQRVELKSSTPEQLCEGWNAALASILGELNSDLAKRF